MARTVDVDEPGSVTLREVLRELERILVVLGGDVDAASLDGA